MEQIKKKSKIVWYVLGAIVLLLVCLKFIIIASYPGDETKFNKVFSEKYWKISDIELKALTIDGEDISSPNQTIGNKIQDKIDANYGNKRALTPLESQFKIEKMDLEKLLVKLYELGNEDSLIPLIKELYEAN